MQDRRSGTIRNPWSVLLARHRVSMSLIHRNGPLERLWWGGGYFRAAGIFFRYQIPCMKFFRTWHEYFLGFIGVHVFFSFSFPLREYFFVYFAPPPPPPPHPYKFSNGPSHLTLSTNINHKGLQRTENESRGGTWVFFGWVCATRDSN